ncbi:MAG: MFS transporter [Vicinamibacterales bacterium]|nr:MFS transporter [Vicinamibacterales bacterium]
MTPASIIFITVFIDLIGFGIVIPLAPFYAEHFGATGLLVGLLQASFSLMQFLFAPFWGRLSDRIGRKPVILIGLFGSAVSYLMFGLAESLAVLFVARIFAGIAGANISTAQAYMADVTTPENRAKGMGMVGAAFGLGFIFGPAIGGALSTFGPTVPPLFAGALSFANFVAAWFILPESRKPGGQARLKVSRLHALTEAVTRPGLPQLLLIFFLVTAAFSSFEATFALFGERRFGFTPSNIGYVFAFVGVVLTVVQGGLVGRMAKRFGEPRLVPFGIIMLAGGLALLPLAAGMPMLLTACALLAVGSGFNNPSISSLISRISSADEQGGILGVSQSVSSLARIIGPFAGGAVFDRFGSTAPFAGASVVMMVALAVALTSVARMRLAPNAAGHSTLQH